MTLKEAIEHIYEVSQDLKRNISAAEFNALKIGIEAIKRFDSLRSSGRYVGMPLLKGETVEQNEE